MPNEKLNILVIDDDPIIRNLLRSILKEKFNVYAVEAPSLGFNILAKEDIAIVISDFKLPEMNGLKVLEKVREEYPDIEVIMISSSGDMDTVIQALRKGAADFFKKPFKPHEIWVALERTMKFKDLNKKFIEVKNSKKKLKEVLKNELGVTIIGQSPQIEEVKKQIQMVAQTPDTSVLIIGESGTGKELVARGIHDCSARNDDYFGAVNMSAIPENLFESEFFGHKKGSFTGAVSDKSGWFETTSGGTLFLDEVGEMDMSLQVKLLRVLEDRQYTKIGTQKSQAFDIRVVAATNKSVEQLTSGAEFRVDLFHRLGTFIIHLPPLRDRKEDIPVLAQHFLKSLTGKMGKQIKDIHAGVFELLNKYSFPGNIRELRNIMERAIIMCTSSQLKQEHFFLLPQNENTDANVDNTLDVFDLYELEKRTIERALLKVNNNKAEAARLLNLEWNALYRRIKKHKINF